MHGDRCVYLDFKSDLSNQNWESELAIWQYIVWWLFVDSFFILYFFITCVYIYIGGFGSTILQNEHGKSSSHSQRVSPQKPG